MATALCGKGIFACVFSCLFSPIQQAAAGETVKIVQIKRNWCNCSNCAEDGHFMRDAWKQIKMPEFHGNCGKRERSAPHRLKKVP